MHIEGRYKGEINPGKIKADEMPENIALLTTVQFLGHMQKVKEYLEKQGKEVSLPSTNAYYPGQVLGCSIKKLEGFDCILYVGDGQFHPIALALENNVTVYTFNPFTGIFDTVRESQVKQMMQAQKAAITKFYHSKKIGLLISLKPGQFRPEIKEQLQEKYPDKEFFTLVFDTLQPESLENFAFIDCFVNTSCPRISYDDYLSFNNKVVEFNYVL